MISKFVNYIIRPKRNIYNPKTDLGPATFLLDGIPCGRSDFIVINQSKKKLHCSLFHRKISLIDKYPCLIYCHGNSGNRTDCFEALKGLLKADIIVVAFDFSGTGLSEGDYISLGYYEKYDIEAVIDYLLTNFGFIDDKRIGIWGRSMGAVAAMLYTELNKNLKYLVLDSPFSDFEKLIKEYINKYRIVSKLMGKYIYNNVRQKIKEKVNFDFECLKPIELIKGCYIPVLILHGVKDSIVHPDHSRTLFEHFKGDKQLLIINSGHNDIRPEPIYEEIRQFILSRINKEPEKNILSAAIKDISSGSKNISSQSSEFPEIIGNSNDLTAQQKIQNFNNTTSNLTLENAITPMIAITTAKKNIGNSKNSNILSRLSAMGPHIEGPRKALRLNNQVCCGMKDNSSSISISEFDESNPTHKESIYGEDNIPSTIVMAMNSNSNSNSPTPISKTKSPSKENSSKLPNISVNGIKRKKPNCGGYNAGSCNGFTRRTSRRHALDISKINSTFLPSSNLDVNDLEDESNLLDSVTANVIYEDPLNKKRTTFHKSGASRKIIILNPLQKEEEIIENDLEEIKELNKLIMGVKASQEYFINGNTKQIKFSNPNGSDFNRVSANGSSTNGGGGVNDLANSSINGLANSSVNGSGGGVDVNNNHIIPKFLPNTSKLSNNRGLKFFPIISNHRKSISVNTLDENIKNSIDEDAYYFDIHDTSIAQASENSFLKFNKERKIL